MSGPRGERRIISKVGGWLAPSAFPPPKAGILFVDDSPGSAPQTLIPSLGCSLRLPSILFGDDSPGPLPFPPQTLLRSLGRSLRLPSAKCRNPIRDDSPGPAHSRGRGRIILHTGGAWRIPPGAYPPRVGALELSRGTAPHVFFAVFILFNRFAQAAGPGLEKNAITVWPHLRWKGG